jgi:DtxR family Mn-dependent transcriptional regulator
MLEQTNKEKKMELTNSQEEYLLTIYDLYNKNRKIRVTDIANVLGITKPSVNKAINNLKELELIEYEKYSDISLTNAGEKIAKELLKRQDIMYIFLNKIIGVEEERALKDSIAMKHAISKETADAINEYISKKFNLVCNYDISKKECKLCIQEKEAVDND